MPLPIATRDVHIRIVDAPTGTPAVGTVTFYLPVPLRDATDRVILAPGPYRVSLDPAGEATIALPVNDEPGVTPVGWAYDTTVHTGRWRDTGPVQVPSGVGALEFSDIFPGATPGVVVTYATVGALAAHEADTSAHGIADTSLLVTAASVIADDSYVRGLGGARGVEGRTVVQVRSDLGLGGAALLDVGTTPGTVAAGDDPRFAAAVLGSADFTVTVDRSGPLPVYTARNAAGVVVATVADTATTSGLKSVMSTILPADSADLIIQFGAGRFHFLDAPLGTEAWAGVEDHASYVRLDRVTFRGLGDRTIISNYTNQTTSSPDTEPFSFTNSRRVTIADLVVESCGRYKSTTDAIDFDSGEECTVSNVIIRASRARGIVIDGGNAGQSGSRNRLERIRVKGHPAPAQMDLATGGSLAVQDYTYCVAWRCNGLGVFTAVTGASSGTTATLTITAHSYAVGDTVNVTGMSVAGYNGTYVVATAPDANTITYTTAGSNLGAGTGATVVGPDVTKPSEALTITTTSGSKRVKVYLEPGPYSCVARVVYRWDGATWKKVATVTDNTTTSYTDDGTGSPPAATFTTKSTIPDAGIELLGAKDNIIEDCDLDGVGDLVNGATGHGVNIVRKTLSGVAVGADRNQVTNCRVRRCGAHGVRVAGGSYNQVHHNQITNPGVAGAKAQGVRIEGIASATTNYNQVDRNVITDDRTSASPDGTSGINNAVAITATNSPTGNVVGPNLMVGYTSSSPVSDSGVSTEIEAAERTITLMVDGALTTGAKKKNFNFAAPWPATIKRVRIYANTAPVGAAILVDVNINGSTIWSTQGNRVTIADGANGGTQTTFNTTAVAAGDLITFDVDQVGSGTAGADLVIELTVLASRVHP